MARCEQCGRQAGFGLQLCARCKADFVAQGRPDADSSAPTQAAMPSGQASSGDARADAQMSCPSCGSHEWRSVPLLYSSGFSSHNELLPATVTSHNGYSSVQHRPRTVTRQTHLSALLAPPRIGTSSPVFAGIVLAVSILLLYWGVGIDLKEKGSLSVNTIIGVCAFAFFGASGLALAHDGTKSIGGLIPFLVLPSFLASLVAAAAVATSLVVWWHVLIAVAVGTLIRDVAIASPHFAKPRAQELSALALRYEEWLRQSLCLRCGCIFPNRPRAGN